MNSDNILNNFAMQGCNTIMFTTANDVNDKIKTKFKLKYIKQDYVYLF